MSVPLVLGVARTHDVAAVLMRGSELLGIAEAERIVDVKHARGVEALKPAVETLCAQLGLSLLDIDAIAIADSGRERIEIEMPHTAARAHGGRPAVHLGGLEVLDKLPLGPAGFDLRSDIPVFYTCHHSAHAVSALYQAGYAESAILIADGYGTCCGTIAFRYDNGAFERLESYRDAALLGWRYQLFGHLTKEISSDKTDILDLAGKVMGLNAYGNARPELAEYFVEWFRKDFADYQRTWHPDQPWFGDLLPAPLSKDSGSVEDQNYLDVVASMQEAYSRTLEGLSRDLLRDTGSKHLILSGGCALNVLANTRIAGLTRNSFFQPIAGDAGIPLGAAVACASALTGAPLHHPDAPQHARRSPYLGTHLLDRDTFTAPEDFTVTHTPGETAADALAGMLANGQIVGVVRGRSEIGPRALGNRSILASGADPNMRAVLNQSIKNREWWRPFAPVCRAIDADKYFDVPAPSPYMLTIATAKPEYREAFASACHEDGTARLQVLPTRDWNPLLWDILEAFQDKTGIGVLINTSFNVGGKPILNRAETAIGMLRSTNMHAVWINETLVVKP